MYRSLLVVAVLAVAGCSRLSANEQRVVGTWDYPTVNASARLVFRGNHSVELLAPEPNTAPQKFSVAASGRWRVEDADLIYTLKFVPSNYGATPDTTFKETIAEFGPDELIFKSGRSFSRAK
jgi:hypothetical protein